MLLTTDVRCWKSLKMLLLKKLEKCLSLTVDEVSACNVTVCFRPRCACCVLWGITCSRATDQRRLAVAGCRWTMQASLSASWAVMYLGSSMLSTVML